MEYFHLSVKLLVGFVVLFVVARFIGGRELKKLNVFDFISAIVLSELVGNVLYQDEVTALHMSFALVFWTILIYIIDKMKLKIRKARSLFDGEPALIIEKGRIRKQVLKDKRLDLNELLVLLREKEIFSIREVDYAFLEGNGNLSVLRGRAADSGGGGEVQLPAQLILDGQIMTKTLNRIGRDSKWLNRELEEHGVSHVKDVFYAEYTEGSNLLVQKQPDDG
ncbi:DUF421 domain-containing protein [Gorillibacterium sp. sgz5001074]|uniref:DUF421 domain-containing protein n=1 Tax=Gorillibacterium sp. sgz5001074 TaxID=3446695 RepID=UPI003F66BA4E